MTTLRKILDKYRSSSRSEREKGTYFEELSICYLQNEPRFAQLYKNVWTYADWAKTEGLKKHDTGIDLVAKTRSGELHAVQCKLYSEDRVLQKRDIDSFFTASGKKSFSHRIIISTTNRWSANAEAALQDQQPPVTKLDLYDLETSLIDWNKYKPSAPVPLRPRKKLRPHQHTAIK